MHAQFLAACFAIALALVAALQTPLHAASTGSSKGAWGIDLSDRDSTIRPGDNFYMSQNGSWFARTELGKDLPNSAYWRDLRRLARNNVAAILEENAADKNVAADTPAGKAAAFFRAYMDQTAVEARGVTPLIPALDAIRAANTKERLARLMGQVAGSGTNRTINVFARPLGLALWGVDIAQDINRNDRYAVYVRQGGLLLPGPEFYLDPQLADMRSGYEMYIEKMLRLIDWPDAVERARQIVAFETRIALVSWSHEQMNDVVKTNNVMTVADLIRHAPGFDWRAFFAGAELSKVDRVIIDAKDAFPRIAAVYSETPTEVLQARQAFALVDANADALCDAVVLESFQFRTKQLAGQGGNAPLPRAERAAFAIGTHIDEIVGSLYAKHLFSHEAKNRVLEMTTGLRRAFDERLANLSWMASETKVKARDKLSKMTLHIGYPDQPEEFKGLQINDADLYGDMQRSAAYKWNREVEHLKGPFLRTQWNVTADYPNYSYQPSTNTLEIPAALLQPPFFDIKADAAVNYGAIGALIGETMMIAFDPQGRHYDETGQLREWWTANDAQYFDSQTQVLRSQYSAVEPLPGLHIKGDLVVSESVDDLGGLLIALDAYHKELKGRSAATLDGFTGDQRFFLGRAQMWRAKFGVNFVRNQIATGVNSPPFLRVNGPIRNMDAWYSAFDVQPSDKLYVRPEERVRIW